MSLKITTTNANDMNIRIKHARISMKSENSKIQIDQSVCFSESGLKDVFELIRSSANFGKQKAAQGIARIASEGDQLMRIENGGKPIVSQAIRNAFESHNKGYNVGLTPRSRPKISATSPKLTIDVRG